MQDAASIPFNSVAFIGFGNMATAITDSFLDKGIKRSSVHVYGGHQQTEENIKEYRVVGHKEGENITEDILIVAVKPQVAEETLSLYKDKISDNTIIISIMAGVSYQELKHLCPNNKIARAMPNLGAAYGQSMTAIYTEDDIADEISLICNLFGDSIVLDDEDKMHAFTAVAGSGPAHFFYLMNEMISFTKDQGFTDDQARGIVTKTAQAAVLTMQKTKENCDILINKVASKGGTTEAAITYYQHKNAHSIIKDSLVASAKRSLNLIKKV